MADAVRRYPPGSADEDDTCRGHAPILRCQPARTNDLVATAFFACLAAACKESCLAGHIHSEDILSPPMCSPSREGAKGRLVRKPGLTPSHADRPETAGGTRRSGLQHRAELREERRSIDW